MVTVEPCIREPLDFVLYDESRPIDLPPADDEGIREACPLPGDILTPEDSTGESSLIHSDFGSFSESALPDSSIPDHGGQPVTVHGFLQDMTTATRKAGRKYGRSNHLGTVKLDAYDHNNDRCGSPNRPSTSNCHIETQTQTRNDRDDDQRISAYPPGRVQSEHLSRQISHLRRKKRFAKPLAQRLFEADVFSSGTSSRSTGVTPDQNPAHTSTRRPLQFITSLNLTPSLETRIYGKARTTRPSSGSADSEIQPVSQADDSVPDSLEDDDDDRPGTAVATSGGKTSSRNWSGGAMRKGTRARASPAAMRGSGTRAIRTRLGGGKRSSAQVPHNPFGYFQLPLVLLGRGRPASRIQRTGATVRKQPPQSCTVQQAGPGAGHARTHMRRYQNQFQLMSADNHDHGQRSGARQVTRILHPPVMLPLS